MPRGFVHPGLRGPAQEIFPEEAKEYGRDMGLTEEAEVFKNEPEDIGGAPEDNWVSIGKFRARIDRESVRPAAGEVADQTNESSVHVISFDPGVPVNTNCRVEIKGQMWYLTGKQDVSDPLIDRYEAQEVVG